MKSQPKSALNLSFRQQIPFKNYTYPTLMLYYFHFTHCITIDKKIHTTGTRRWRRWSACFYSNEAGAHHQKKQKSFQHFQTPCPPVISLIDLVLLRLLENNCTICSYSHMSMFYLTSLGTNQILLIKNREGRN